jgi:hypothetical protein
MQVVQEINVKLEGYVKESFIGGSSKSFPPNALKLQGSNTEFLRPEIIRTLELIAINSEIEQPERLLLLVFLLKYFVETNDSEMFTEIIKFLYHLSELRRFADAFLFTLDDIHYFGAKLGDSKEENEIHFLLNLLKSDFFNQNLSKPIQIVFIGFLANLSVCSKKI